jgi:Skp family chaperone for outer membrane proteins
VAQRIAQEATGWNYDYSGGKTWDQTMDNEGTFDSTKSGVCADMAVEAAQKFEESSVMLSASNRAAERKKLVDQQGSLQRREQELQQRAATRRQELVTPFEQRVTEVIEAVRKEGNYALVFDVSGQTNQIVAADTSLDITQRVIDRVKAAGPPTPASGAPRND